MRVCLDVRLQFKAAVFQYGRQIGCERTALAKPLFLGFESPLGVELAPALLDKRRVTVFLDSNIK